MEENFTLVLKQFHELLTGQVSPQTDSYRKRYINLFGWFFETLQFFENSNSIASSINQCDQLMENAPNNEVFDLRATFSDIVRRRHGDAIRLFITQNHRDSG